MTGPAFQLNHIGLLVRSIEQASELHAARYGYRIESPIIHDPVQTARVRFLRLPGAGHWLELVSPEDEHSKLSAALKKRGESLHHLCYEVCGLETACASLREGGQMLLSAATPAAAFPGRRIAWFMDRAGLLTELVEAGPGALSLATLPPPPRSLDHGPSPEDSDDFPGFL